MSDPTSQNSAASSSRHPGARPHRRNRWLIALGIVVAVLLLIQLVASPIVESILNKKLTQHPEFAGKVSGVTVALWRGAVELKDFSFGERAHQQDPPLLRVQRVTMRFAPGALLRGKLGGAALVDGVELNLIKRDRTEKTEEEKERAKQELEEKKAQIRRWQDVLRESLPVTVTRFEVKNARVRFVDITYQPNAEIGIENIHIVATDLQNRPKANGDPMPAKLNMTGVVTGGGKLKTSLQLDPMSRELRFALNFEVREQQLPAINSFLVAYTDADVSRGTFELFSEIDAENGAYNGYVKPMFHDLDFKTASDKDKNVAEKLKEKVVSAVTSLMENKEQDQVATKAPFSGNFADNDVDVWTAVVNLMRNAFVQALRGGFEGGGRS
jgi:hypothetical protein